MESIKINITNGSGKMISMKSINSNTLTNPYCKKCKYFKTKKIAKTSGAEYPICYSAYQLMTCRMTSVNSYQHNSEVLSKSIIDTNDLPRIYDTKYMRINSHGELINMIHLINIVNIVKKNHDIEYGLWTKRYDLIYKYFKRNEMPKNLHMIFSNSEIDNPMNKIPKYFHKTFNNITKDNLRDKDKINCDMKCSECLLCYTKNNVDHIVEYLK
tara:strand:- start:373 stop:1011 length:639 start_codon:yes stop_codon:yes gene_type:complete